MQAPKYSGKLGSGYLAYGNPCKPVRPITAADSKRHLILEEDLEHFRYNV